MTKEQFAKAITSLQNLSIEFKIDYNLYTARCFLRGIVISNPDDLSRVKSILDSDILKHFKFRKSKEWYLGDNKEVIYLQLKNKLEISIAEFEKFQVNNYA
jgi:hypothetical protein